MFHPTATRFWVTFSRKFPIWLVLGGWKLRTNPASQRPTLIYMFVCFKLRNQFLNELYVYPDFEVGLGDFCFPNPPVPWSLLGETKFPIAVCEWTEHGLLEDCLLMRRTPSGTDTHQQQQQPPPLPWKLRLKIAAEVANVVVYLHTAFSRPIVHRDITASNIVLGQQNVAKLCDFSRCIPILEGEVRVEVDSVAGTVGYFAPEYRSTWSCSEKVDVFSFGILLLVLLTAQKSRERCDDKDAMLLDRVRRSVKDNGLADIVDPRILAEPVAGCAGMNQQLERFAELAPSCAADHEEDRPEMIDVQKQLCRWNNLLQVHAALSFLRGCHD